MTTAKKITWQVTENNAGGLTLYVYEAGEMIWAAANYQFDPQELRDSIAELADGAHPLDDGWDGNALTDDETVRLVRGNGVWDVDEDYIYDEDGNIIPLDGDEFFDDHATTKVIASDAGPVPYDSMGCAGQKAFYPHGEPELIDGKWASFDPDKQAEISTAANYANLDYPIWEQSAYGWDGAEYKQYTVYYDFEEIYEDQPDIEADNLPWEEDYHRIIRVYDDPAPYFG